MKLNKFWIQKRWSVIIVGQRSFVTYFKVDDYWIPETVETILLSSLYDHCDCALKNMQKNIYVADLTEELVTTTSQVLAWIRKGEGKLRGPWTWDWCFQASHRVTTTDGFSAPPAENRHYAKTKMNERSSRSHTIFRMVSNGTTSSKKRRILWNINPAWFGFLSDPGKQRNWRTGFRGDFRRCRYCVSFGKIAFLFFY